MQATPQAPQLNEELHCLLHIQQSPHCFDSQHKKNPTTLHTKHTFFVPQQPNLLLVDTFVTKACFYRFFLHQ